MHYHAQFMQCWGFVQAGLAAYHLSYPVSMMGSEALDISRRSRVGVGSQEKGVLFKLMHGL